MAATRARTKPAAEVEPEEDFEEELVETETDDEVEVGEDTEDELDDLELDEVDGEDEEVEEDETPAAKPKRGAKKAAAPKKKPANAVEFGTAELLAYIEAETTKKYDGRQLRVLLRKMKAAGELPGEAADGKRYSFSGPEDAKVVAIIKRVKAGEIDEATKAALDKLKADAEKKRAAAKAAKEAEAAEAGESDEDEDGDDLEVEEAPKPARKPAARKPAAKKTPPARRAPARKKATDVVEDDEDDTED